MEDRSRYRAHHASTPADPPLRRLRLCSRIDRKHARLYGHGDEQPDDERLSDREPDRREEGGGVPER